MRDVELLEDILVFCQETPSQPEGSPDTYVAGMRDSQRRMAKLITKYAKAAQEYLLRNAIETDIDAN